MSNIEPKVDTILCRTFNTYEQRLGGSVVVMKKTLVTDPARISAAATTCGKQALKSVRFSNEDFDHLPRQARAKDDEGE